MARPSMIWARVSASVLESGMFKFDRTISMSYSSHVEAGKAHQLVVENLFFHYEDGFSGNNILSCSLPSGPSMICRRSGRSAKNPRADLDRQRLCQIDRPDNSFTMACPFKGRAVQASHEEWAKFEIVITKSKEVVPGVTVY